MEKKRESKTYITHNPAQTKKMGKILAEEVLKSKEKRKNAFVLGLKGNLGSGKTCFLQGFAKGLGIREKILSPTFVGMKRFQVPKRKVGYAALFFARRFYHFDCYRVNKPKEILEWGFKEIVSCPDNIVAIEWSDKINPFLPKNTLILKFKFLNESNREIIFNA